MVEVLGFPSETLVIEKNLELLPHVQRGVPAPKRRADLLCFAKGVHPLIDLYPLLLVECKAVPINDRVIAQVVGYNHYVHACFICVANQTEIRTGWKTPQGSYEFVPFLPPFSELKDCFMQNQK